MFIIEMNSFNWLLIIYYLVITSLFFSCIGAIVGFLYFTWDIQQSVSNFFIIPLSLLSGTFFSIGYLPENLKFILYYNPYYYVVSFFRNCFNNDYTFQLQQNIYILFFIIFSFTITAYVYFRGYNIIK